MIKKILLLIQIKFLDMICLKLYYMTNYIIKLLVNNII